MMSKETNGAKKTGNATKRWSFLDISKQVLDEEKDKKNSVEKETVTDKEEAITSSDNIVEAEPDINRIFKHR
ncbi:hypothetical protein [Legionella parisiensis]|uniref:Uncharacterized protein n=1 Tax=Legionella parisiensis TaxID=45071 RepID=A0A1E5JMM2_9GAMM|nr:hypothetical protein [Legionella parisiensis]KTD41446.1 hypothetical protein Lpar_2763 [Legionella parisiensis]OEH45795.1 hypothetical protein lpari_03202 [Legionella parisiensis]STX76250.1 Uncharacterised protein [Legionella parisiensis]